MLKISKSALKHLSWAVKSCEWFLNFKKAWKWLLASGVTKHSHVCFSSFNRQSLTAESEVASLKLLYAFIHISCFSVSYSFRRRKKNPWNMIRWRSFAYRLFHPRSQFTRITNYENMLRVSVFPQHWENDIPMHDAHFTVSFWTFSSLTFVNDLGLRHWIHVVETRTIEQFKRENILQFIPRDCFVRLGLSMLSRRLDVSCTIRFFGSVTKLVSLSLFHTISTMESMLDDRGSFSWFLWEENFNESEGEKKMRMNGKP